MILAVEQVEVFPRMPDRLLTFGLAALVPPLEVSLRLAGYQRTRALLMRFVPKRPLNRRRTPPELARAVNHATAPFGRNMCLRRALLLEWLLRRRGYNASVQTGITSTQHPSSRPRAHAWVEIDGVPINPKLGRHGAMHRFTPHPPKPGTRP